MPASHFLLLPGMMCDHRLWQHQIENLDASCSVPDLSGSDSLPEMARKVLADAPEQFAVAGLSMGGILAFELWRQAPQRITHLALIDTNPFADPPERKSTRLEQIMTALNGGLRELAVESLKPAYLAEANRDDEELLETILDMALKLGPNVFRDQSLAIRNRDDSSGLLPDIDVPTVVICGAEDRVCPVSLHEYMAERIPGAELLVIPDCGHLSTMESPADVTEALAHLLTRNNSRDNLHANQLR